MFFPWRRPSRAPARRTPCRHRRRPRLELLEDRVTPATFNAYADVADGATDSLRWAVIQANNNSGADVIILDAGVHNLTVAGALEDAAATGDLDVLDLTSTNEKITIIGAGRGATVINQTVADRVFHLAGNPSTGAGPQLELRDLTVQGGFAEDDGRVDISQGGEGGGILAVGGAVTLTNVTVRNNTAAGPNANSPGDSGRPARGGGLAASGTTVTLTNVAVLNNTAQGGAGAAHVAAIGSDDAFPGGTGGSATGGGLALTNVRLTMTGVRVENNVARGGGGGEGGDADLRTGGDGGAGGRAFGGGLAFSNTVARSVNPTLTSGNGGDGGTAQGGGIYALVRAFNALTVEASTVSANTLQAGAGGQGGSGAPHGRAGLAGASEGGGGYFERATANAGNVILRGSTFSENDAGTLGSGGGLFLTRTSPAINAASTSLTNVTIAGNTAATGGGLAVAAPDGPDNAAVNLLHVSVAANHATGTAGGVHILGGTFNATNFLFGDNTAPTNTPPDFDGAFATANHNLLEDATGSSGITHGVNGNLVGVDPGLAGLGENGGPTKTIALLATSPAHDAADGTAAGLPTTDQRGGSFPRVSGRAPDNGAFEVRESPVRVLLSARLVTVKVGTKKLLFVRARFDTGETVKVRSPFQEPGFTAIKVAVVDTDGDGLGDAVKVSGRKAGKTRTRLLVL